MTACRPRDHSGPIELRRRDSKRCRKQCEACKAGIGPVLWIALMSESAQRKLKFWLKAPPKGNSKRRAYQAFLRSPAWKTQRARILARDHFTCRRCGELAESVDHQSYRPVLAEVPDSELVAACMECNLEMRERRMMRLPAKRAGA